MYGFLRVACAVPDVYVSDVKKNTAQITEYLKKAAENKADIAVFPNFALRVIPARICFSDRRL